MAHGLSWDDLPWVPRLNFCINACESHTKYENGINIFNKYSQAHEIVCSCPMTFIKLQYKEAVITSPQTVELLDVVFTLLQDKFSFLWSSTQLRPPV